MDNSKKGVIACVRRYCQMGTQAPLSGQAESGKSNEGRALAPKRQYSPYRRQGRPFPTRAKLRWQFTSRHRATYYTQRALLVCCPLKAATPGRCELKSGFAVVQCQAPPRPLGVTLSQAKLQRLGYASIGWGRGAAGGRSNAPSGLIPPSHQAMTPIVNTRRSDTLPS